MQPSRLFHRPLIFLALLASGLGGCAVNPVTGDREVSLMSPAQEAKIGTQAAAQVEQEIGLVRDPALTG